MALWWTKIFYQVKKLCIISLKYLTIFNIQKYKQCKNKLISILKFDEKFLSAPNYRKKEQFRKVWAIIKHVINKNKNSRISDQFITNDKTETDPIGIDQRFNNYFANIEQTLVSKMNRDNVSHRDFLKSNINASFFKRLMKQRSNWLFENLSTGLLVEMRFYRSILNVYLKL